jgi:hypothetical protein
LHPFFKENAKFNGHNVMRKERVKPEFFFFIGVQSDSPPVSPLGWRRENRLYKGILDLGDSLQAVPHIRLLPSELLLIVDVLPLASSACGIVGTGRLTPCRGSGQEFNRFGLQKVSFFHEDFNPHAISGSRGGGRKTTFPSARPIPQGPWLSESIAMMGFEFCVAFMS